MANAGLGARFSERLFPSLISRPLGCGRRNTIPGLLQPNTMSADMTHEKLMSMQRMCLSPFRLHPNRALPDHSLPAPLGGYRRKPKTGILLFASRQFAESSLNQMLDSNEHGEREYNPNGGSRELRKSRFVVVRRSAWGLDVDDAGSRGSRFARAVDLEHLQTNHRDPA